MGRLENLPSQVMPALKAEGILPSEEVFVFCHEFLQLVFIPAFGIAVDTRTGDELFHLLEHLGALLHDGGEIVPLLLNEGGIIVADLFDDEGEDAPGLVDVHAAGGHLREDVVVKVGDVLGLCLHFLCGLHGMEITVDEGLTLMQVALVEDVLVAEHVLIGLHFLELLGMHTCYGYADAAHTHHQTAVAVYADDVAFESCQLAGGDAKQDAVAGIVMEGVEEEADALGRGFADAHERLHLRVGYLGISACAAALAEMVVGETLVQIGSQEGCAPLKEDKTADGGGLLVEHFPVARPLVIAHGLVYEMGDAVLFQPLFYREYFAVMDKEIGPRTRVRVTTFLYLWASLAVWLRNVVALWRWSCLVGCR